MHISDTYMNDMLMFLKNEKINNLANPNLASYMVHDEYSLIAYD